MIITELQLLVSDYQQKQMLLSAQLETTYRKMNVYVESNPYHKADKVMHNAISGERNFLNPWTFSLKEEVRVAI